MRKAAMFRTILFSCVFLAVCVFAQESKLMPNYFDHPCVRTCEDQADPMECRYRFVVESYQSMSKACYDCAAGNISDCSRDHCVTVNGFSRNIKTVNRGVPGPTIQVCEGDTIIVDLQNYFAMTEGVTIHWHGILQRFSPHMDGVGMITQCPIQAYTTFQYRFVALDPGTHFWHAHTGLQRGEGVFGSLVVRQPPSREPHTGSYDFDLPEHVLIVNEWQNKPLVEIYTAYHHADGTQSADAVLINGRSQDPTGKISLPRSVFRVKPGQRYRFRVINSGSLFCPIQISIDNHDLTLIASDGRAFEPFVVQSFDVYSAERYDFILTADQPVDNYWMRARGLGACEAKDLEELAVIQYLSPDVLQDVQHLSANTTRPEMKGILFNSISVERTEPLGDPRDQILGMNAVAPDDRSLTGKPDHQFILDFQMRDVDNLHYFDPDLYPPGKGPYRTLRSAQISRISNRLGPVPLLAQMDQIPEEMLCNETSVGEDCETKWCECVHRLRVQQDDIVEMVFISPAGRGFTHPIHVHGYSYRVVAMERVEEVLSPELFREMDARGEIKRKLSKAPFKDTVPLPNGGYVIIRFVADNPGVWFAHCHLAFHAEIGMALSLEVLGSDGKLPPPPENFPTCGPFQAPRQQGLSFKPNDAQSFAAEQTGTGTGNSNLMTSGGSGPPRPESGVGPEAVAPQWVLPLVISMSVVIAALVVVVVRLWKKNVRAERREQLNRLAFPSYLAQGESTGWHESGDESERAVLTR